MLREAKGARRYNDVITLTKSTVTVDGFGHADITSTVDVLTLHAMVRQMSATKTALTFQIADVIGVDIEFRIPAVEWDGITWRGHDIHFPQPEVVDDRGRIVRVSGWYQKDNPEA